MAYRVVQWATGNVGRAAIEGILAHPELELAGVWVFSEDKTGKDAGEICGTGTVGVKTTNSIDDIIALKPDCVLYSPLLPNQGEVIRLLEAGINVVTPLNWFYPKLMDVTEIEAACRKGNSTLHGTGIHPGGITERVPLTLSAFSQNITHVRSEEFSDCRAYGAVNVLSDIMLFGKTPEEMKNSIMLQLLTGGFSQSIRMIGDALRFDLDSDIRSEHEYALATAPIDTPIGFIEPGRVAAQRFTWQGTVRGEPVITAIVNWFMGHENLETRWNLGKEGDRYEVEITGDPPVKTVVHGIHDQGTRSLEEIRRRNPGIVATATHCVSAIPYVCAQEPGIKTYLDLPLVAGRAAPSPG